MALETCSNRCWCSECSKEIYPQEKFYLLTYGGGRHSGRLNICFKCLIKMGKECEADKEYWEMVEQMPKEKRNKHLKVMKGLSQVKEE